MIGVADRKRVGQARNGKGMSSLCQVRHGGWRPWRAPIDRNCPGFSRSVALCLSRAEDPAETGSPRFSAAGAGKGRTWPPSWDWRQTGFPDGRVTGCGSPNPRTPRKRAEVMIERAVLLHQDGNMFDIFGSCRCDDAGICNARLMHPGSVVANAPAARSSRNARRSLATIVFDVRPIYVQSHSPGTAGIISSARCGSFSPIRSRGARMIKLPPRTGARPPAPQHLRTSRASGAVTAFWSSKEPKWLYTIFPAVEIADAQRRYR